MKLRFSLANYPFVVRMPSPSAINQIGHLKLLSFHLTERFPQMEASSFVGGQLLATAFLLVAFREASVCLVEGYRRDQVWEVEMIPSA